MRTRLLTVLLAVLSAACNPTPDGSPGAVIPPLKGSGPAASAVGTLGEACGGRGRPQDCEDGLYCNRLPEAACGRFDAPGTCIIKPVGCPKVYKPVCGCDGLTYGNECAAAAAGMSVDYEGVCP